MKALALTMLRLYKRWISPSLAPSCRYVPTCSEYAMEAIDRYGVLRGGMKAAWRLLRCHPFVKGGLDPVVKNGHGRHDSARIDRVIEIGFAGTANNEQ
jgi:putative membrane protein insertion efficiency factor